MITTAFMVVLIISPRDQTFCSISLLLLSILVLVLPGFTPFAVTKAFIFQQCHLPLSAQIIFCKDDYPQFPVDDDPKPKKKCHQLMKGSVPCVFSFRPPPKPVRPGKEDDLAVGAARTAKLETKKDNDLVFTTAYGKGMMTNMAPAAAAVVTATPAEGCKGGGKSFRRSRKAYIDGRTKLALHTNIRFHTLHRTCISKILPADKRAFVLSHIWRYSLSSHHHLGTQILRSHHEHSLSGPSPIMRANLLRKQSKNVCLLRKSPKQISSHAGSHAAACRPCSARNTPPN